MESPSRIRLALVVLCCILAMGTIGYLFICDLSLLDAFYMTIITIATVGFREVCPLDSVGKVFTILLIVAGLSTVTFTATSLFQFMIEGQLMGLVKRRKMDRTIDAMRDHFIICGFGRVGEQMARDLRSSGKDFVVVDHNPEALSRLLKRGYNYVEGNATSDEVLQRAGITRAKALAAASDSDSDNVLITISARMLNPDLFIVARASTEDLFQKLEKAGANRVVSPYKSAGQKMVTMLLKPVVHEYLDLMVYGTNLEIGLEEVELSGDAEVVGMSIKDSAIRKRTGSTILAIKKRTGEILTNPPVSTILEEGDRLIMVGTPSQLALVNRKIIPEAPGQ
jgi:voltage-gated potassium channel